MKLSEVKAPTDSGGTVGTVKTFTYESGGSGGRLISETDALNNTTHYGYNLRDQIIHTWGTKVNPVANDYDGLGRRTSMIGYQDGSLFTGATWPEDRGVGSKTTWEYDPDTGLLTSKTTARTDTETQTTSYGYDAFNRMVARYQPNGRLKKTRYNAQTGEVFSQKYFLASALDDPSPVDDPLTPDVFYAYDSLGNVERVQDGTGLRRFSYIDSTEADVTGLLHEEALFEGNPAYPGYIIKYDYDSGRRRLAALNHGLGSAMQQISFGYRSEAPHGLLNTLSASGALGNKTFTYGYKADTGWVESITSGLYEYTRGYEPHRNLVEWTKSTWNTATNRGEVSQTRDALGRIVTLERKAGQYALYPGGGIHQSFGYTSKGEMESAITASLETPATALRGRSVALSYDGQGNRVMGVAEDPWPLLTTEETCQMARISGT